MDRYPTLEEINACVKQMQESVRECLKAAKAHKKGDAYKAAEHAQEAAFDLKQLFHY